MSKKSIFTTIIVISILVFTKVSGLLRDALAASIFGATDFSDSFFLTLSIVLTLYNLIGKAITLYLIPKFEGKEDYGLIKSFIIKGTIVVISIISLYLLFSDTVIRLFYSGDINTIKQLFTAAILSMVFIPTIYTLVSYYQSKHRFYISSIIGLLFNMIIIVFILLDSRMFKYSFFVTILIQCVFLLYFIDFKKIKSSKIKKIHIKELIPISIITISMAFEQINIMIDRKFISDFKVGELTFLDLGSKVSFMFMGIIVLGITTVIYPKLSNLYKDNKNEDFLKLFKKSTILLTILSSISIIGIIILGDFILKILFMHGSIESSDISSIGIYLKLYIITILPLSIREMMMRFMIIRKNNNSLLFSSIVGLVINFIITSKATEVETVVSGSVIGITVSTIILSILFIIEIKKYKRLI